MTNILRMLFNWLFVMTSPLWILPAFIYVVCTDKVVREKMLTGNGLIT